MPELPEVETIVRELNEANLVGLRFCEIQVLWPRSISETPSEEFCQSLQEQKIVKITRRGKFIMFTLSKSYLFVHLRMTGKFFILPSKEDKRFAHERIRLQLSDGRYLVYEDQRKFGKWYLVKNPGVIVDKLGLEPLTSQFTLAAFRRLLHKSSKQIKPFLLDQSHIAGLGNIYVDEALWEAKIHPLRPANTLSRQESAALFKAIKNVLEKGIKNTGTSLGSHRANYFSVSGRRGGNQHQLNVFRREGCACPRCCGLIIKMIVGQRGTHICPACQKYRFIKDG